MKIAIFGMGYVGVVSGACLIRDGHQVIGIDPVAAKIADLRQGRSPIQEPQVANMLATGAAKGLLNASTDPADGVREADMCWICVGTPSTAEAGIDLSHVTTVVEQIGRAMRETGRRPLLVVRSTVLPGTTGSVVVATLEASSGLRAGADLRVVFHPEFLREGSAVADFDDPPKIVVGEHRSGDGDLLMKLYETYDAPKFRLDLAEAELVKYSDNLFHALKVTFANEIGQIAKCAGIDARRVADVFCADTKLNISARYLRPGFAFGGSCLPKDLRAILRYATLNAISTPMLRGVLESNVAQVQSLIERVKGTNPRRVGIVGIAFKKDTDDMRESPFVMVAKALIGEGIELAVYDGTVNVNKLIGSNKNAVETAMGHLKNLLVESLDDLDSCDTIVVNHSIVDAARIQKWTAGGARVIDVCGIAGVDRKSDGYEGIAW